MGSNHSALSPTKALWIALLLTSSFVVVELAGGLIFGSLALAADAAHLFTDAVALAIALVAQRVAARPASSSHSWGWRRVEVLAAFANGLLLAGVSVWIVFEAIRRIAEPVEVQSVGLLLVASAGLVVNLVSARLLHRSDPHNVNVRAAALHTLGDAAGSVGAIVAGVSLLLGGPQWSDPVASILISVLVIFAAVRLLRETTHVLLEATPKHLDPAEIERTLGEEPSVMRVHHLHVWSVASNSAAMSAHVELRDIETLHEAQAEGARLKSLLQERFAIRHTTLELECHPCDPVEDEHL